MISRISGYLVLGLCIFLSLPFCLNMALAQDKEETYSISLVKTAEIEKDIRELDHKKVLTHVYTVRKGDWLWKVLRERGLLKKDNLPELLSVLKKLNNSLEDLDLILPGDKIIVPLKIMPFSDDIDRERLSPEEKPSAMELKYETYAVKPGDSLVKVIKSRHSIAPEVLYDKYFKSIKTLNPSIKDLDIIYPGQLIRIPIDSSGISNEPVDMIIISEEMSPSASAVKKKNEIMPPEIYSVSRKLGIIFEEMGEDWIQSGEHFIPLKSGGQITLKAAFFPIINLQNGLRVIVDLKNGIPEKMVGLITSNWENYRVVHLSEDDDLRSAMDKVLQVCDYIKVQEGDKDALELKGDIALKISGDWIITLLEARSDNRPSVVVVNLTSNRTPAIPWIIKRYLAGLGIKVIDYPQGDDDSIEEVGEAEVVEGRDASTSIESILRLVGKSFSRGVEIPIYQSRKAAFELTVKADFFLKTNGRDAIIDLTGLPLEIISLLNEHQFLTLSLAVEKGPVNLVTKTLGFLGIQFDQSPHFFTAIKGVDSENFRLTLPGISFSGVDGKEVFAAPLVLPNEIAIFLRQRGYEILVLPSS